MYIGAICENTEKGIKALKSLIVKLLVAFFIFIGMLVANVLIPTTKEMIIIKALPIIANSKIITDKLPKQLKEYNEIIKNYLKGELKKE